MTNRDFRDLFSALNACEVRFLVVGAYAVTFHARARFTKDLDLWIDPEPGNAQRAWRALALFGAPVGGLTPADLSNPRTVFQIGVPPNRIDILTTIDALEFDSCWRHRVPAQYADCSVAYLSREDLITNKRAVGRPQDLLDVQELEDS